MNGLFLYGASCTSQVWSEVKRFFSDFDITYVEYSHDVTQNAQCVEDITRWVADKYKDEQFDFIENSCHMPMIENPQKLAKVILDIIK